eukprot:Rmarinus@m.14977
MGLGAVSDPSNQARNRMNSSFGTWSRPFAASGLGGPPQVTLKQLKGNKTKADLERDFQAFIQPRGAERFTLTVPLKPIDKPGDLDPEIDKVLKTEYVTRYLESLGVRPSKQTIAMIKQNVSLDKYDMMTAYKSRGHLDDAIYFTPDDRQEKQTKLHISDQEHFSINIVGGAELQMNKSGSTTDRERVPDANAREAGHRG